MQLIECLNSSGSFVYTGIGSRETPDNVCYIMTCLAYTLESRGATLRSGGAPGADLAFENGVTNDKNKYIYIPWRGFNCSLSNLYGETAYDEEATKIASEIHPAWDRCNDAAKKLHMRNVFQILGYSLDNPSKFVLFYATEKNGKVQGGTATAVNLARKYNVPTFNLKDQEVFDTCSNCIIPFLKEYKRPQKKVITDFGF